MKLLNKLVILMIILSFGFFGSKQIVKADWWEQGGDRPVLPREDIVMPTQPPEPTNAQPTNPPNGPTVTPTRQGGPEEPTATPGPTGTSSNDDPCANGKTFTGDYCGWSPRIGGENGGGSDPSTVSDPSDPQVMGLSYTSGAEVGLSDIMLLGGLLCLALYAKSKFAPDLELAQGRRRSR